MGESSFFQNKVKNKSQIATGIQASRQMLIARCFFSNDNTEKIVRHKTENSDLYQ